MKLKIILLIMITFFLISCGTNNQNQASYNFKQGVGLLNYEFLDNAPPNKIYPNSNFKIILKLENQAAYDLTSGQIKIIGLDEKYFTLLKTEQTFGTLAGKSLTNPNGEFTFIEFSGRANELFENSQEYIGKYWLQMDYFSELEFSDNICINPNLYDVYDSGCQRQDQTSYSGQGGPIAVSHLEQITVPQEIGGELEFRITITNKGRGTASYLNLRSARLGNEELNCNFQGGDERNIQFNNKVKEAILVCKKYLRDQQSYITPLYLEFGHDYEIKEQQQLRMVNPLKSN